MARRQISEPDFDRELFDLPPELRWREWKARVEAVLFAAAKPVARETLARVVGRDCALDLLLDDLKQDLRGRPIELVRAGSSLSLPTRPRAERAERAETFGREISRDLIAGLREGGLTVAGPLRRTRGRSPSSRRGC
jgi:chromosome segregation and condensation protein ScpB